MKGYNNTQFLYMNVSNNDVIVDENFFRDNASF